MISVQWSRIEIEESDREFTCNVQNIALIFVTWPDIDFLTYNKIQKTAIIKYVYKRKPAIIKENLSRDLITYRFPSILIEFTKKPLQRSPTRSINSTINSLQFSRQTNRLKPTAIASQPNSAKLWPLRSLRFGDAVLCIRGVAFTTEDPGAFQEVASPLKALSSLKFSLSFGGFLFFFSIFSRNKHRNSHGSSLSRIDCNGCRSEELEWYSSRTLFGCLI